jgi:hypothetical protein
MGDHRLIAWIREEITATWVVMRSEVVRLYREIGAQSRQVYLRGHSLSTTSDGMYEIHQDPIYADVPRTVLDERRASDGRQALVTLILSDVQFIYSPGN